MGKILLDNDYALLTYTKENCILSLTWKKCSPSNEYLTIFKQIVQFATENKVKNFVSDIRNEGAVPINNLRWLKENVISQAYHSGVKKIAIIFNEDLFSTIYTDLIRKSIDENLIAVSFFSDPEEAILWFNKN